MGQISFKFGVLASIFLSNLAHLIGVHIKFDQNIAAGEFDVPMIEVDLASYLQ